MGIEKERSRKKVDDWALIMILLIATSFGVTIFAKNWQYGTVFYLVLFFAVIAFRQSWLKHKIFRD